MSGVVGEDAPAVERSVATYACARCGLVFTERLVPLPPSIDTFRGVCPRCRALAHPRAERRPE